MGNDRGANGQSRHRQIQSLFGVNVLQKSTAHLGRHGVQLIAGACRQRHAEANKVPHYRGVAYLNPVALPIKLGIGLLSYFRKFTFGEVTYCVTFMIFSFLNGIVYCYIPVFLCNKIITWKCFFQWEKAKRRKRKQKREKRKPDGLSGGSYAREELPLEILNEAFPYEALLFVDSDN